MKPENTGGGEMKTLHLTLKKKWFDMILSGEKKEEYREIKQFWIKRITGGYVVDVDTGMKCDDFVAYSTIVHNIDILSGKWLPQPFDTITFTAGNQKSAPKMIVECKGIHYGVGNPDWGAAPREKYFVIKLGEILKTEYV